MNKEFSVTLDWSNCEVSKRQLVELKTGLDSCESISEAVKVNPLKVTPSRVYILEVHNERATKDKDYRNIVIYDDLTDTRYISGSEPLIRAVTEIMEDMEGEKDYQIEIYSRESKNYSGQRFLCARLV